MNSFKILCCAGSFVGFSFMSAAGWLVAQDAPKSDVPPAVTEAVTEEPEASKSESKTAENPTTSTSLAQEKQEAASTDSNDTQEESLKRATPDETQPAAKEMPAESDEKSAVSQEDGTPGKIRFRFDEIEWAEVIDWFAEQNGFSLFPIVQPPEGTFKYFDDQEYTVLEGLDQLNHALALQGGYTLIRNRKMLVLTKKSEGYPSELIEEIDPTELEDRGKYEIVRCIFDINGLEETDFASEV